MNTDFREINLYVYHSLVGMGLDIVIWCLGPLVDKTREYGLFRRGLALGTRKVCALCLVRRDPAPDADPPRS